MRRDLSRKAFYLAIIAALAGFRPDYISFDYTEDGSALIVQGVIKLTPRAQSD